MGADRMVAPIRYITGRLPELEFSLSHSAGVVFWGITTVSSGSLPNEKVL